LYGFNPYPAYNAERCLGRSVGAESVVAWVKLSSLTTAPLIKPVRSREYERKVKVIRQENRGAAARNTALREAQ
jgi:hypothetical protein